jgi:hypothetical protein
MKKFEIEFVGVAPLLMHSCRGANPLDPDVKFIKTITSKKNKTDEDHEKLTILEYMLNAYYKKDIGFYIPANVIEMCIKNGSKHIRLGKKMPTAIEVIEAEIPLKTDAPNDINQAVNMPEFVDIRNVVVNGKSRIMRTRPRFDRWRLRFTLKLDDKILNEEDLFESLNYAGSLVGICDYRPEKGGKYGRFEVKITEIV